MSQVRVVLRIGAFVGFSAGILAAYETRRAMTSVSGQEQQMYYFTSTPR